MPKGFKAIKAWQNMILKIKGIGNKIFSGMMRAAKSRNYRLNIECRAVIWFTRWSIVVF